MFTTTVEYENYEGKKIIKDLYFNLTKMELMEVQRKHNNDYPEYLRRVSVSNDNNKTFDAFKELLLSSYGEVDPKTGKFLKTEEIRNSFEHSEEYSTFFMQMLENKDQGFVEKFLKAVMPKDIAEKIDFKNAKNKIESNNTPKIEQQQ